MYMLLQKIIDPDHNNEVMAIVQEFYEGDVITEEIAKARIMNLEKLKPMGELGIYNELKEFLKADSIYGPLL
ncbi:MAG: hypothetical protein NHB14_20780 [Desulfosporosinus sp.]|nr:hypothetical protein [Desulfosporosinus sp.]